MIMIHLSTTMTFKYLITKITAIINGMVVTITLNHKIMELTHRTIQTIQILMVLAIHLAVTVVSGVISITNAYNAAQ
jgi:hypothetical protein